MIAPSPRIASALAFACGVVALLAVAQQGSAAPDGNDGAQLARTPPCGVGHRFEPGPIVDGHYRQPTRAEFEARTRELQAMNQRTAGSCAAPPPASTAGEMASETRPGSAVPIPQR
jgi:hypothetical protein